MKTLKQIREAKSGGKEAYQKFFNSLLKKFGVSSPAELKGDDKKKFYDELDAGWESDDPNDKNERHGDPENLNPLTSTDSDEDLADKAASKDAGPLKAKSIKEGKLKAGRGKAKLDVDMDASEYKGGERAYMKDMKKKYKVSIKMTSVGADLSGDKASLLKFLQSDDYGMDDSDIEELFPELMESHYPKPLSIIRQVKEFSGDAETVRRKRRRFEADEEEAHKMNEKMVMCEDCGKMHEEGACIHKSDATEVATEGKRYPVMNQSQRSKIIKIAKKHSGDMQQAIKDIEKLKKGMSDNPDVMDILKKANESEVKEKVDCDGRLIGFKAAQRRAEGEKQKGKVIVDRRTKGYKEAKLRSEKAKAKKEAATKKKAYEKKYPKLDYAYGEDAELRKTMEAASRVMGYTKKDEDAAANSVASGNVDMAPNMGKKKKKDKAIVKRSDY